MHHRSWRYLLLWICLVAPIGAGQSLTTTFVSNNGGSPGWVNMFDVTVLNPSGIRIMALDVNISSAANTPFGLDVYLTPTTYVGKELTPTSWVRVSTGNGVSVGRDLPSPAVLSDFVLKPGTYGVGIHFIGGSMGYTNGTGGNQSYQNADLSLQLGAAVAGFYTGMLFTPRVWNGTIYYAAADKAWMGAFGTGCQGSNGVATLRPSPSSPMPQLGQLIAFDLTNLPTTPGPAFMLLGFNRTQFGPVPLPLDLTPFGLAGCNLYVAFTTTLGFANIGGIGTWRIGIPTDPALLGGSFFCQALSADTGSLPFVLTGGGQVLIGL